MNIAGILSDPQGRPPIICLGTDFLNSFPGLGNSRAFGIMIVLALTAPTGDQDSTLSTTQRRITVKVGQNRGIHFTPDIPSAGIGLSHSSEEFGRSIGPFFFFYAPEESDCSVWSIVNLVAVISVWVNDVDGLVALDIQKNWWCRSINKSFMDIMLFTCVVV